MPNIPCPQHLDCESADAPLAGNLTAEAPDVRKFFKTTYRRDSSVLCESTVSQALVDLCNPPPDGSTVIFSSSPQSNSITCPNGAIVRFDANSGLALGFTQGESDATAGALLSSLVSQLCALGPDNPGPGDPCTVECAGGTITYTPPAGASGDLSACEVAQMLCELNPLVPNTAQTCTQSCPNGESRSFTMPAGTFYGLSQVEADAQAYQFACLAAVVTCGTPPVPTGTEPDNSPIYWTNSALFCSIPCGGTSSYFQFIAAGLFFRRNLSAANSAAASHACQQGATQQFCLGALTTSACLGVAFSELIASTTGTLEWTVIGQLPTGLSMSNGLVFGTPSVAGSYSFAVRAMRSDGSYAQRIYSMTVAGIITTALSGGEQNVAYAELLEQSGFTDATWSIISGGLPTGITLNADGIISGTPTGSGTSTFNARVIGDNGAFCDKELSIVIQPASSINPVEWWKMDESGSSDRIGSYAGTVLTEFGSAGISSVAGVIGNATRFNWASAPPNTGGLEVFPSDASLAYASGNGLSIGCWIKSNSAGKPGICIVRYQFTDAGGGFDGLLNLFMDVAANNLRIQLFDAVSGAGAIIDHAFVASGAFQFFQFYLDPIAAKVGLRINNAFITEIAVTGGTVGSHAKGRMFVFASGDGGVPDSGTFDVCDVSAYPIVLNTAQNDYLWNSGNGQSWPAVLPP